MNGKSRKIHEVVKKNDIFWIGYSIILLALPYNVSVFVWLKQMYFIFLACITIIRGVTLNGSSFFNLCSHKLHFEKLKEMYGIDTSLSIREQWTHPNYKLYRGTFFRLYMSSIISVIGFAVYVIHFKGGVYPFLWLGDTFWRIDV